MERRKIVKILILIFFLLVILFSYNKFFKKQNLEQEPITETPENYSSNVLKDVNYTTKDIKGNEYIINAKRGEIDISNTSIIFLTNVDALIKLTNSEIITITSDFGKYNINNFDTIFSENVIIKYLENKINGDYADFSLKRNSMIVSKNVIYSNLENILYADVIDVNIETKDTIIYMHEKNQKVNIKSKN